MRCLEPSQSSAFFLFVDFNSFFSFITVVNDSNFRCINVALSIFLLLWKPSLFLCRCCLLLLLRLLLLCSQRELQCKPASSSSSWCFPSVRTAGDEEEDSSGTVPDDIAALGLTAATCSRLKCRQTSFQVQMKGRSYLECLIATIVGWTFGKQKHYPYSIM